VCNDEGGFPFDDELAMEDEEDEELTNVFRGSSMEYSDDEYVYSGRHNPMVLSLNELCSVGRAIDYTSLAKRNTTTNKRLVQLPVHEEGNFVSPKKPKQFHSDQTYSNSSFVDSNGSSVHSRLSTMRIASPMKKLDFDIQ